MALSPVKLSPRLHGMRFLFEGGANLLLRDVKFSQRISLEFHAGLKVELVEYWLVTSSGKSVQ